MATGSCQAVSSATSAVAERVNRGRVALQPPPRRRGQIKERIFRDVVAAVVRMYVALLRADKSGGGGFLAVSDDTNK